MNPLRSVEDLEPFAVLTTLLVAGYGALEGFPSGTVPLACLCWGLFVARRRGAPWPSWVPAGGVAVLGIAVGLGSRGLLPGAWGTAAAVTVGVGAAALLLPAVAAPTNTRQRGILRARGARP